MSKKYATLWLWIAALVVPAGLQAQENLNASGGDASGSGGSASYSIGQLSFQSHSGANGSLMEGVQQAYEIYVETFVENTEGIKLMKAYPNPAIERLTLEIQKTDMAGFSYVVFDLNGRMLERKIVTGTRTEINMQHYASSVYLLRIFEGEKEVKTFKIIKN